MNLEDRVRILENDMMLVRDRSLSPISVKVGSFTCPAATGYKAITGVGFKPRYVEFMAGQPSSASAIQNGVGWMDYNGNQGTIGWVGSDDLQRCKAVTTRCLNVVNADGDYAIIGVYISMDNDGFTINFTYVDTEVLIFWKAVR